MAKLEHEEITRKIIGLVMKVHNELGSGFVEKVYQQVRSDLEFCWQKVRMEKSSLVTTDGTD